MRAIAQNRIAAAAVVAAGLVAVACGGRAQADPAVPDVARAEAARIVAEEADLGSLGVDPESVVVAAMLLTTGGDLAAALADGVVTPADVDAAVAGLESGTLDELFD